MSIVLEAVGLHKTIGKTNIVKDISFTINGGEVFGFLGPNGAGKTTTIRMLLGLIRPTAGTVKIAGYDIRQNFERAMEQVGCIIESPDLYNYMSGRDNLYHFANMLANVPESKINEVAELVKLTKRLDDPVEIYSTGMKQRLGLAQALLGDPRLLILDEPTNGLDPSGIHEFRELILYLAREKNMAVFVSSHILSEMELLCDRVAMISQGQLIYTGRVDQLTSQCIHIWETEQASQVFAILRDTFQLQPEMQSPGKVSAVVSDSQLPEINRKLSQEQISLRYVYKRQRNLEDVFLEMTEVHNAQAYGK